MHDPTTDEALIAATRSGDMDAFDQLYARYERRLYGYIVRLTGNRELAEDLFQEVFMGVLKDRSFDPDKGRFAAWLFTVARNRCLMERRKQKRRRALRPRLAVPEVEQDLEQAVDRNNRVWAAMEQLTEPQRQLLLLKQVGELTYKEIASMLDVAEGTVKSRLHAATVAFRHQLAQPLGHQQQGEGT